MDKARWTRHCGRSGPIALFDRLFWIRHDEPQDHRRPARLRRTAGNQARPQDLRLVSQATAFQEQGHPRALERRGGVDPLRRQSLRPRLREQHELSRTRPDDPLSRRHFRSRIPFGLRQRALCEQGRPARRQPLPHHHQEPRGATRARQARAVEGRAEDHHRGSVTFGGPATAENAGRLIFNS